MSHQPRLFSTDPDMRPMFPVAAPTPPDVCGANHRGAETSRQAYETTSEDARTRDRATILEAVRMAGLKGLTTEEISTITGISYQTASGRVSEMVHRFKSLVRRGKRPTKSGKDAFIHFERKAGE